MFGRGAESVLGLIPTVLSQGDERKYECVLFVCVMVNILNFMYPLSIDVEF